MNNITKRQSLAGLLEWACAKLELSATVAAQAKERYDNVGKWLADTPNGALAESSIYSQGSARIGTAIKPVRGNEFDIDLVVELPHSSRMQKPADVRNIVGARLREHGDYKRMLEPINRGWRLVYANAFRLDITPAIPDPAAGEHAVLVPDRKLADWKESNPVGFGKWFEDIAKRSPATTPVQVEMRADFEPLPENVPFKGLLKRAVQLYKRHRDVMFCIGTKHDPDLAPISIVITTLAARAYRYVLQNEHCETEFDVVLAVLRRMPGELRKDTVTGEWLVPNPTNHAENFAEKWAAEPAKARAFFEWQRKAVEAFEKLANAEGIDEIRAALAEIVGESAATSAAEELTKRVNRARTTQRLTVASSAGLAVAPSIVAATPRNTFFGSRR